LSAVNWFTTSAERTLSEVVPAAPDEVRAFYVDLDNIRLVHPLVVSVRTITRREMPDGYVQVYRVRDRIPLWLLTVRTTYTARLYVPEVGDVIAEARQFPAVRLDNRVAFERCEAGTRVVERMRIQAPRLLAPVTIREAVNAHIATLAGIRDYFA
jgi:hypothetical protein